MATASKGRRQLWLVALLPALASSLSFAQEPLEEPSASWSVTPRFELKETLTSNVGLSAVNAQREQITEAAPGVLVQANSSDAKVFFDYRLRALAYAQNSRSDTVRHALNTFGNLQLVDDFLFVDFSGEVAQQTISAFETQVANDVISNPNRTETSSFRLSPYVHGRFLGKSEYEFRHVEATTFSKSNRVSDIRTKETSAVLKDIVLTTFAWSINANQRQDEFDNGGTHESERARAMLAYRHGPELQLSANAGREANNYASPDKAGFSTSGYDVRWTPGPRTELFIGNEKRFFGNAQSLTLSHRTPKTVWRYGESKDISVLPNQFSTVGLGNIYDLLFSQMASIQPEPALRSQAVIEYLQARGIPAETPVTAGFLSSRVMLQKQRNFSVVLTGVRSTLTLLARESESQALTNAISAAADDFSSSSTIRLRGLSAIFSHRLTPFTTLTVGGQREQNIATGGTFRQTTLRSADLSISTRMTDRISGSLAYQRNRFESSVTSYRENVVVGALSLTL